MKNINHSILLLWCVLMLLSCAAFAGYDVIEENYLRLAAASDVILDASVAEAQEDIIDGTDYTLLKLKGSHISSAGSEIMDGHYVLRVPGSHKNHFLGEGRFILFVTGNGGKSDTRIGRIILLRVKADGTVATNRGHAIMGIAKNGRPIFSKGFNSCTIANAPPFIGPQELLTSFACPDGSQWHRGADRPDNYVGPTPLTIQQFNDIISTHLKSLNMPVTEFSNRNFESYNREEK